MLAAMPKGPRGEKRPADAIGRAVMIAKIATGEVEDEREGVASAAAQLGSRGGKKRAENMAPERRVEIARKAARTRWAASSDDERQTSQKSNDQVSRSEEHE